MSEYIPAGTFWVCFDLSNGHKPSRRYVWWFDTRKAAVEFRKETHKDPHKARVSAPIKVRRSK